MSHIQKEMDTFTDSTILAIYQERKKAFDEITKILEDRKERYTRLLQAYDAVVSPKPSQPHEKAYYQVSGMDLPIFKSATCKNTNLKFSVVSVGSELWEIYVCLEGTKEDLEKADAALMPWKSERGYVYKIESSQYPTNDPLKPQSIYVDLGCSLLQFKGLLGQNDDLTICSHAYDDGIVSINGLPEHLAAIVPHLEALEHHETINHIYRDFNEPFTSGKIILRAESIQAYAKESKEAHSKIIDAYRANIRTVIGELGKDNYTTKRCLTSIANGKLLIKLILTFDDKHDASIVEQWFLYTARKVVNFKVSVIPWIDYHVPL